MRGSDKRCSREGKIRGGGRSRRCKRSFGAIGAGGCPARDPGAETRTPGEQAAWGHCGSVFEHTHSARRGLARGRDVISHSPFPLGPLLESVHFPIYAAHTVSVTGIRSPRTDHIHDSP